MSEMPKKYEPFRRLYSRCYGIRTAECNPGAEACLTQEQAQGCCDLLNLAELNPDMSLTEGFGKVLEEASLGARAKAGYGPWRSVNVAPENKFVLVRGDSGYITTDHFVVKAQLCTEYQPPRWLGVSGDPISDNGWIPTEWMEVPE